MKNAANNKVRVPIGRVLFVGAIIGLLIFVAVHPYFSKPAFDQAHHAMAGFLFACLTLRLTSIIWLSVANVVLLLVASPFLILPSLRPVTTRVWTIAMLALLSARLVIFSAGLPANPNRIAGLKPTGHGQVAVRGRHAHAAHV